MLFRRIFWAVAALGLPVFAPAALAFSLPGVQAHAAPQVQFPAGSTTTPVFSTPTNTPTVTATPGCGLAWNITNSPNAGPFYNSVNGISALSGSDVWAVGSYITTSNLYQPYTLHWGGTGWSLVALASVDQASELLAVAAVSSADVWAVGYTTESGSGLSQTLIEHWDGAQWTALGGPAAVAGGRLLGVSALSANNVWAVGNINTGPGRQTLTMHWDGAQWATIASPNPASGGNTLQAVSGSAANDVWAVGYGGTTGAEQTLVLRWNGNSWGVVSSVQVSTVSSQLFGVVAFAPNNVWVAGYYFDQASSSTQALLMHWTGLEWLVSPPPAGFSVSSLLAISGVSGNDMWAVGGARIGSNPTHTLTMHGNGTNWNVVPSPNAGGNATQYLQAVDALLAADVWAAGVCSGGGCGSLIMHYADPCLTTPTVTSTATSSPTITRTPSSTATSTSTSTQTLTPTGTVSTSTPTSTGTRVTDTPSVTSTLSPTQTASSTDTATVTVTVTASATRTSTPSPTATLCPIQFSDVHPSDYFYIPVQYLYCHGAISGYADNTFRPFNDTTRGQLSKIVVLAEGFAINTQGGPHFTDVPASNPFYAFVETAYNRGLISGYADGTFRWGNNVTRAQLCKIVVLAEGWPINIAGAPHFTDVPPGNPFYYFVETAYNNGVISGYADGTFRPNNNATRGQISKIVYSALTAP